jgi:hypothetical protein
VQSVLLLEETRSTVCSAIHNHAEIQYCQLLSAKQCDASSLYFLDIDLPKTRSTQCHHIFKDLDVCLLSSAPIGDSTLDIQSCSLAIVTGVGRDIYFQRSFRVNMETPSVLSGHDEKNCTAVQAILRLYKVVSTHFQRSLKSNS